MDVLAAAAEAGADFIDIEYDNFIQGANRDKIQGALAKGQNTRLIVSAHDFAGRFGDIRGLYADVVASFPGAIPKLVYKANHINDCFEAFDLLHQARHDSIVFCMGQAGLISRIIAKKLGCFVTFASLDRAAATAPGQLTIETLTRLYRYQAVDAETRLYGVIAAPVAHSFSPAVHNASFAEAAMNKLYLPLLVEGGRADFERFMDNVTGRDWLDFNGFSVTIPHKRNALEYVKGKGGFAEPLAERIGAVNTILLETGGQVSAYNTDYAGALDAITSTLNLTRVDLRAVPVGVIGAGGVARAIVAGLCDAGARVKIYNRTVSKAERLAEDFNCEFGVLGELADTSAKLLVNATSVGMYPDVEASVVDAKYLKKGMTVFDTVYNPVNTQLLKDAERKGLKTIDGVSMFVNQAAAQFKLFTGLAPNPAAMRKSVIGCLQNK
jgi:3-dehydroquinate dehydratase/shikimate dehydrogenase